ncbi:MAG TPA: hypothetical protein VFG59_08360 [Anaeromyxobacter sp.]|nr:hypothetical protein [Anaeromyxobacter sp.]
MERCPTCSTPLDESGACVTCSAQAEGLAFLARSDYASVREIMGLLEEAGMTPHMERVPAAGEQELSHPRWNLYVPKEQAEEAQRFLGKDWRGLLADDAALEAARRGAEAVDLDAGGEITCPACGHAFAPQGTAVECPECGLGLGAPGEGE